MTALVTTRIGERSVGALTCGEAANTPHGVRSWSVPRSVKHCACSPYKARPWWVYTWKRGTDGEQMRRHAFKCRSWRCAGECARHDAAVMFARMRQAFTRHDARHVVFMVLTLDRDGTVTGEPWRDSAQAYRELSRITRNFLARLNRWCAKRWGCAPGSRWVATVEAHRSGWPHINIAMVCPALAAHLRKSYQRRWLKRGGSELEGIEKARAHRDATLAQGELLAMCTGTGWGPQCTMEGARNADAVVGYLTKVAGDVGHEGRREGELSTNPTIGEVVKLTQLPLNAPGNRFKRLRSGKGFLPPRFKGNPLRTGGLVEELGHREHRPDIPAARVLNVGKEAGPTFAGLLAKRHAEAIVRGETTDKPETWGPLAVPWVGQSGPSSRGIVPLAGQCDWRVNASHHPRVDGEDPCPQASRRPRYSLSELRYLGRKGWAQRCDHARKLFLASRAGQLCEAPQVARQLLPDQLPDLGPVLGAHGIERSSDRIAERACVASCGREIGEHRVHLIIGNASRDVRSEARNTELRQVLESFPASLGAHLGHALFGFAPCEVFHRAEQPDAIVLQLARLLQQTFNEFEGAVADASGVVPELRHLAVEPRQLSFKSVDRAE